MINKQDLIRCIDILSELNANATNRREKNLLLELGYIIKQELDLVKTWEYNCGKQRADKPIDVQKLLEDNTQLYRENETLIKNLNKLKNIIDSKLPSIFQDLTTITEKFNVLNHHMENVLC